MNTPLPLGFVAGLKWKAKELNRKPIFVVMAKAAGRITMVPAVMDATEYQHGMILRLAYNDPAGNTNYEPVSQEDAEKIVISKERRRFELDRFA